MRDYSRAEIDRLGSRLRKMARSEGKDISLYVDWSRSFGAALEEVESELDSRAGTVKLTDLVPNQRLGKSLSC